MMIFPKDWDKPSPGNRELCGKFGFGEHRSEYVEQTMPYRLFRGEGEHLPLVIYLHGADAVGDDNVRPLAIHDIGTMFAREAFQAVHPCHILAPQYGYGSHWSMDGVKAAVQELVEQMAEELDADPERIYIYGYSAGGVGTLRLAKEHPDFYAAAISICGATGKIGMKNLCEIPLWMVHAADDEIVKCSYQERGGRMYHYGSRDLYEALEAEAPLLKYTEYPRGYMQEHYQINAHCSWVCVSDEKHPEFGEWLFAQRMGEREAV